MDIEREIAIQTALIGAGATFITAMLSVALVVWQIKKQAKNALQQNSHNKMLDIKLKVYEELLEVCRTASDSNREFHNFVLRFERDIENFKNLTASGLDWPIPSARGPETIELRYRLSKNLIQIISFAERWQSISKNLELVKLAINVQIHELSEICEQYFDTVTRYMPVASIDSSQGDLLPWVPPTDENEIQIKETTSAISKKLYDIDSLIIDIVREMQNLLVGELFGNQIAPRTPIDPNITVLRFDKHDELNNYYRNETSWGKMANETEARVRAQLSPE